MRVRDLQFYSSTSDASRSRQIGTNSRPIDAGKKTSWNNALFSSIFSHSLPIYIYIYIYIHIYIWCTLSCLFEHCKTLSPLTHTLWYACSRFSLNINIIHTKLFQEAISLNIYNTIFCKNTCTFISYVRKQRFKPATILWSSHDMSKIVTWLCD